MAGPRIEFSHISERQDAIPIVASWWFEEWGHLIPGQTLESTEQGLRQASNPIELPIPIVAMIDSKVVGAASLKLHEMISVFPDTKHWLGNVFVASDYRGQGIGAALAREIAAKARSLGIKRQHLNTVQLDGGVYGRLGWKIVDKVAYKGKDVVIMVLPLTSSESSPTG